MSLQTRSKPTEQRRHKPMLFNMDSIFGITKLSIFEIFEKAVFKPYG